MEKEGITVFAVNVGEENYKVKRFLKDYALDVRVLLDEESLAAENYKLRGVPTYVFINKDGQVVSLEHRLPDDYKSLLLK
jgi:thioredoxin-related protein